MRSEDRTIAIYIYSPFSHRGVGATFWASPCATHCGQSGYGTDLSQSTSIFFPRQ